MPRNDKPNSIAADHVLDIGPCKLPASYLASAPAQDYTRSAVVLANEVIKVSVKIGDQMVPCKVSMMITRDGVGNEELAKISDVKDLREKTATEREQKEQALREKEIKSAVDLTKSTMIETAEMLGRQNKAPDVAEQIKQAISTMTVLQQFTGQSVSK